MSQLLQTSDIEEQEGARQTATLLENTALLALRALQHLPQGKEAEQPVSDVDQQRMASAAAGLVEQPQAEASDLEQQRVAAAAAALTESPSPAFDLKQQRMASVASGLIEQFQLEESVLLDSTIPEEEWQQFEHLEDKQEPLLRRQVGNGSIETWAAADPNYVGSEINKTYQDVGDYDPDLSEEERVEMTARVLGVGPGQVQSHIGEKSETEEQLEDEQKIAATIAALGGSTDSKLQDDLADQSVEDTDRVTPENQPVTYHAEDYTISRQGNQYLVQDQHGNAIFAFEKISDRGFQITHDSLTPDQRQDFLNAAVNIGRQGGVEGGGLDQIMSDPSGQSQVKQLGGLAPEGSRALVVANQVLNESGKDQVSTPKYQFDRQGDKITISNHEGETLVKFDRSSNQINSRLSTEDKQNFDQNFAAIGAQAANQKSTQKGQGKQQKEQER